MYSFSHWLLLSSFICSLLQTCCLSVSVPHFLQLGPAPFSTSLSHVYSTSHILSLSRLLFIMSYWSHSNFANWHGGGLIILRHPCCHLFYRSACHRPNPPISEYPSSAYTSPQQLTAFLVYISTVHTDGPSISSRHRPE